MFRKIPIQTQKFLTSHSLSQSSILQRKCSSCGQHKTRIGTCAKCKDKAGVRVLQPSPIIQTKLTVGQPDDKYEKEADRVADQVMRMPAPDAIQTTGTQSQPPRIQRMCANCEEKKPQTKEVSDGVPEVTPAISSRIQSLQSSGQPLPTSTRNFFEPRFGQDFSHVRVQTDSRSTQALNARAYTLGHHIVFGSNQYQPHTHAGQALIAHELTHVIQQARSHSTSIAKSGIVQRAQIGRVHTPENGSSHFLYELDSTMHTFSDLAQYYGSTSSAIQRANPGTSATTLQIGQQVKIPAVNVPAANSQPVGAGVPHTVQSIHTRPIDVLWSQGGNRVGRVNRGTTVFTISSGVDVPLPAIQSTATGLIAEMQHRNLVAGGMMLFGYIDSANLRAQNAAVSSNDVNLIARMIWGEQRSQGTRAMVAAAWIAKNRYNQGWGSYSQIINRQQFHGLAASADVVSLSGSDQERWAEAQTIAQEVVNGIRADPTGGVVYFGNGDSVRQRMGNCKSNHSEFQWGQIEGTNFFYSNGDYTANCAIP